MLMLKPLSMQISMYCCFVAAQNRNEVELFIWNIAVLKHLRSNLKCVNITKQQVLFA